MKYLKHLAIFVFMAALLTIALNYTKQNQLNKTQQILAQIKTMRMSLIARHYQPRLLQLPASKAQNPLDPHLLMHSSAEMKKHKIVLTGTALAAHDLALTIKYMEQVGSYFADYSIIIEDGALTDTTQTLAAWSQRNSKVTILMQDNRQRSTVNPLNNFLTELHNNPQYKDFDLIATVDMTIPVDFDLHAIEQAFMRINTWDIACSIHDEAQHNLKINTIEMADLQPAAKHKFATCAANGIRLYKWQALEMCKHLPEGISHNKNMWVLCNSKQLVNHLEEQLPE